MKIVGNSVYVTYRSAYDDFNSSMPNAHTDILVDHAEIAGPPERIGTVDASLLCMQAISLSYL